MHDNTSFETRALPATWTPGNEQALPGLDCTLDDIALLETEVAQKLWRYDKLLRQSNSIKKTVKSASSSLQDSGLVQSVRRHGQEYGQEARVA